VLLRACPSTSSHTRPQLPEVDGAFVAVDRSDSNGWCHICRGGQEKIIYTSNFPRTVGDVDVKGLTDTKFMCPVWRERDCGASAGEGTGGVVALGVRARVCNAAAAAVEVHSAVDAAAAMQSMVSGWTRYTNRITVDPQAGCLSHLQGSDQCIIFSLDGGPRVQFAQVAGLPPSFIDVQQTQEVRGNAREMKPPQNTNLQPLTAPAISPPGPSRKIRAPALCCARTHPGLQEPVRPEQSAGGHTARGNAVCR
jgi:hypothetical protein